MGLAMLHHLGNDLDMCTSSIVGTISSFRKEQCNSSRQWGGDISAQAFFLVLRKPICTTVENHDHDLRQIHWSKIHMEISRDRSGKSKFFCRQQIQSAVL